MPQVGAAHGPPLPRVGAHLGPQGCGARVWRWAVLWGARWWYQPPEALGGGLPVLEVGAEAGRPGVVREKKAVLCVCVCVCAHLRRVLRP